MAKQEEKTKLEKKKYKITGPGCSIDGKPKEIGETVSLTKEGYKFFKSKNWVK